MRGWAGGSGTPTCLASAPPTCPAKPHPCSPLLPSLRAAFNLFSHNSPMTDNGYNEEEMKLVGGGGGGGGGGG